MVTWDEGLLMFVQSNYLLDMRCGIAIIKDESKTGN